MQQTKTAQTNKRLIILIGLIALVLVTLGFVWYRAAQLGLADVPGDSLNSAATQYRKVESNSFLTDVHRERPFAARDTKAPDHERTYLAHIESVVARTDWKTKSEQYPEAVTATYSMLQAEQGTSTLRLTPETIIDDSSTRRALGTPAQRSVVVDQDGSVVVLYRKVYNDTLQAFASELQHTGDERYILNRAIQPFSKRALGIDQRAPSGVFDGRGILHALWTGSDDSAHPRRQQLMHAQTKSSRTFWETIDMVDYVEGHADEYPVWQTSPSIIRTGFIELYAVWDGPDESHEHAQIKFSRSPNGGDDWRAWENIAPRPGVEFRKPTIIASKDETLHVFTQATRRSGSADPTQIWYTHSSTGDATWANWRTISNPQHDAKYVSATIHNDAPLVTYRTRTGSSSQHTAAVVVQRVTATTTSNPLPVYQSSDHQFFPQIATIKDGDAVCVSWVEEDRASGFPSEVVTDGDILLSCTKDPLGQTDTWDTFNITPHGSHLRPALPQRTDDTLLPLAYYDDDTKQIKLRLVDTESILF